MHSRALGFVLGLLIALTGTPAWAQVTVSGEAGAALPLGDLAELADPGPLVAVGVLLDVGPAGLSVGGDVRYARITHTSGSARSDLSGITAWLAYTLRPAGRLEVQPMLGIGVLQHGRRSSVQPGLDSTRAALTGQLAARVSVPIAGVRPYLAAGYLVGTGSLGSRVFPSDHVSVTLGVALPLPD